MPTSVAARADEDRLFAIQIRVLTHEVVELGHVVDRDIRISRVGVQEILVVCLGGNETRRFSMRVTIGAAKTLASLS